jgi:hypothetical protein
MVDYEISALKLDDVTFQTTGSIEERIKLLMTSPKAIRNVYTYFRGLFTVRLYLGDRQVNIANGSPQKCIRMADCATLYFWPYRRKPDREIIETDLHCGIEAARYELLNNVAVRDQLVYVENVLIGKGAIDPVNKRKPRGRVSRAELLTAWGDFKGALDSAKLQCVEKSLGAYETAIVEHIEVTQKLINSIDRQLFPI